MLIESLMILFYNFFNTTFAFHIPEFELINDIYSFLDTIIDYGIEIYCFFIPPFGSACILLIIAIELAVDIYFAVMWVLGKIPMINIH